MKIRIKIGNGRIVHAAEYNLKTEEIIFFCNSLRYEKYFVKVKEMNEPTKENVTCKKCLKELLKMENKKLYLNELQQAKAGFEDEIYMYRFPRNEWEKDFLKALKSDLADVNKKIEQLEKEL